MAFPTQTYANGNPEIGQVNLNPRAPLKNYAKRTPPTKPYAKPNPMRKPYVKMPNPPRSIPEIPVADPAGPVAMAKARDHMIPKQRDHLAPAVSKPRDPFRGSDTLYPEKGGVQPQPSLKGGYQQMPRRWQKFTPQPMTGKPYGGF